jgi:hypothetical protein
MAIELELPKGFESLTPYAAGWGLLETQRDRYLRRQQSPMSELRALYDAVAPRLDEIFTHLEQYPMDALPPPEAALYRIALGMPEVAMAVEVFNQPGVPFAPMPHVVDVDWFEYKSIGVRS